VTRPCWALFRACRRARSDTPRPPHTSTKCPRSLGHASRDRLPASNRPLRSSNPLAQASKQLVPTTRSEAFSPGCLLPATTRAGRLDFSATRGGHSFRKHRNVVLSPVEGLRLREDHHRFTVRQRGVELHMTVLDAPTKDIHGSRGSTPMPPSPVEQES